MALGRKASRFWGAALAPILFDDDDREAAQAQRGSVVAPAARSPQAEHKAQTKCTAQAGTLRVSVHSFQTHLLDLATIAKNTIIFKVCPECSEGAPALTARRSLLGRG